MSSTINALEVSRSQTSSRSTSPASSIFDEGNPSRFAMENSHGTNDRENSLLNSSRQHSEGLSRWSRVEPTLSEISTSQSSINTTTSNSSSQESSMYISPSSSTTIVANQGAASACQSFQYASNEDHDASDWELISPSSSLASANMDDSILANAMELAKSMYPDGKQISQNLTVSPSNIWEPNLEERQNASEMAQYQIKPPPPPLFNDLNRHSFSDIFKLPEESHGDEDGIPPLIMRSSINHALPSMTREKQVYQRDIIPMNSPFRYEDASNETLLSMGYESNWIDTRGQGSSRCPVQNTGRAFYEVFGGNQKQKNRRVHPQVKLEDEEDEEDELERSYEEQERLGNYVPAPSPRVTTGVEVGVGKGERARNACKHCHRRKTRCTEERPKCAHCRQVGADCEYPTEIRRRGKGKFNRRSTSVASSTLRNAPSSSSQQLQNLKRMSTTTAAGSDLVAMSPEMAASSPMSTSSLPAATAAPTKKKRRISSILK